MKISPLGRSLFAAACTLLLALPLARTAMAAPGERDATTPNYKEVRIHVDGPSDILALRELGVEIDEYGWESEGIVRTFVSFADYEHLKVSPYRHEIVIEDWFAHFAERQRLSKASEDLLYADVAARLGVQSFGFGSMGGYLTADEIVAELDAMRAAYPGLVSEKFAIGTSLEGRTIWAVRLSSTPDVDDGDPRLFVNALTHAREPAGMMALFFFVHYVLDNHATDPELQYLLDRRQIYFAPLINPDGYVYNEQTNPLGGGMWRKNRRDNGDGTFGVDLNRNFGYMWGYDNSGSSPTTSSNSYRGVAPFSEPETSALRTFLGTTHVDIALNYHTFGNLLLHPWGYIEEQTPDADIFLEYGTDMTLDNAYTAGLPATILYRTNGSSDDWMYGEQTEKPKIISMTPEVGSYYDNFWPPQERILPLAEENLSANLYATWATGGFPAHAGGTFSQAFAQPGATIEYWPTIRNKGLGDLDDLRVVATSVSAHVSFGADELVIGALAARQNYDSPDAFVFTVAPEAPTGERLDLVLHFYDGTDYMRSDTVPVVRSVTTLASGDWHDPSTWADGDVPTAFEDVFIDGGHIVTLQAEGGCRNLTFGADTAKIDLASATAALDVHGDFTLATTTHNAFAAWTEGAVLRFTGSAPVQRIIGLGTSSSSPWSTLFDAVIVDKPEGKLTTGAADGTGANFKFFLGNLLDIRSGTFELATSDDLEGRKQGGTATTPDIVVHPGATFDMAGGSTHLRRGNFIGNETSKIGTLTVHGSALLSCGSTNRINFSAIVIEDGGYVGFATGRSTRSNAFNPGVVQINAGGVFHNSLITEYWYLNADNPSELSVAPGGEYFTASGTTQLPQSVVIAGNLRFGGSNQTIPAGLPTIGGTVHLSNSGVKTLGGDLTVEGRLLLYSTATFATGNNVLTYGPSAVLQYGDAGQTSAQTTSSEEFPAIDGPRDVVVHNASGVTLHASRTITGALSILEGQLLTGANEIVLAEGASLIENGASIVQGSVRAIRTLVESDANDFGGLGLQIAAGAIAPGTTEVVRWTGADLAGFGLPRHYDIATATASGLDAVLTLTYGDWELGDIAAADLALHRSEDAGQTWTARGGVVDTGSRSVTLVGIDAFSRWALAERDPATSTSSTPEPLALRQNYPNPFNPSTTISFSLPAAGEATVAVHDLRGRLVRVLARGTLAAGRHEVRWDGRDARGEPAASGVYLVRLSTGEGSEPVIKVTLTK